MSEDGKHMTWTRWTVRISCVNIGATYWAVHNNVLSGGRFKVVGLGWEGEEVLALVEYTAAGANSDDIKRKFSGVGIDRSRISVDKIASVDLDSRANADLIPVVASPVPVLQPDNGDVQDTVRSGHTLPEAQEVMALMT